MARLSGTGGGDDRGSCSGTLRPARHEQLCGWRARGLRWGRARGGGGAITTETVTEGARLCARCESGQVLAADMVRGMAGRRSRHEYRSLGELALKGLTDPVETVELLWEPVGSADGGTAIPLPGRLIFRPTVG